jgi:hypothetical protein
MDKKKKKNGKKAQRGTREIRYEREGRSKSTIQGDSEISLEKKVE